ncbi:MAG: DUF6259 domain-containing protein [Kiritimatiellae bacterium]|nr:DUF6259 domain-containing protein [Kiritimatiellia bacterium]
MSACLAVGSAIAGSRLANDALEIRFGDAQLNFAPQAIVNRLAGETQFLNPSDQDRKPDFWELSFERRDATGGVARVQVDNRAVARGKTVESCAEGRVFVWRGLDLPDEPGVCDVYATVTLPKGSAGSTWEIAVTNRSTTWALAETRYPCLRHLARPGEADVLLPHENLGARLLRRFDGNTRDRRHCWGVYECPTAIPMMTAFMVGDAGLYVAAHDSDVRIKTLHHSDLSVWFETPVENAGVPQRAAEGPRYAVTVQAFRGDWWRAAEIYRSWAMRQRWTAKGPLAHRADFPKAMAETDFWIAFHLMDTVAAFSNAVLHIARNLRDVNVGLRFQRWYNGAEKGGMCVNFPENFPPRVGAKACVELFRQNGIVVMPYMNPHIYDAQLGSFRYAQRDACQRADGSWYNEPYAGGLYGKHPFAVMCPFAADWQATVDHVADRVLRELGANAIYFDQVGCSPPRLCFAQGHGHPAGGGAWWAAGRHAYLAKAHAKYAPQGIPVTFEGSGDSYMDVCDGNLVVTRATAEDVPFYPAVYSGHALYFGIRQNVRDQKYEAAFAQMGREFLWGVVNGWNWDWPDRDRRIDPRCGAAAQLFARAHAVSRDFLVYGRLLDDLRPAAPMPRQTFDLRLNWRGDYYEHLELPAVGGTWWQDAEGRRQALFAVNVTDETHVVRVHAPVPDRAPTVRAVPGQNAAIAVTQEGADCLCTLPSRSVGIFVWDTH